jgi:hypothetical protein
VHDLLRLSLDSNGNFTGTVSIWAFAALVIVIAAVAICLRPLRNLFFKQEFEVDEVQLGIGNGTVKLKPNNDDLQFAYRLWVELRTRKLGLPFDEDHDVIIEIYNSWYEFFRLTRDLMKAIPVTKIRDQESTQQLVKMSIDILNKAIRPHLTKWQARFRRWYESEVQKPDNLSLSSQEVQQKYPQYSALVKELKDTNAHLVAYSNLLGDLLEFDAQRKI